MKKLSIVVPVYNEENTLKELIALIESVELPEIEKEIIIIDDGSLDGTREILKGFEKRFKIIYHPQNKGKGSAVRDGFLASTGDLILIQDADLEYDPAEYPSLIDPILSGQADVVYGSRFRRPDARRAFFRRQYLANRILTFLSNKLSGLKLSDMETCYKVFSRRALDLIKHKLKSRRFGIEPEITALVAKEGLRIKEVGISYYGRSHKEGKKINWKDGLTAVYHVINNNLFR